MKSFKDYVKKEGIEKKGESVTELIEKLAAAKNGKPSGELLAEILREAEKNKRKGTLSNEEIDAFCAQFSPLLGTAEKRRLASIADKLKKI